MLTNPCRKSVLAILAGTLLVLLISSAFATDCSCTKHNADANASGTCSVTEDSSWCTLSFETTTPQEYQEFVNQLRQFGLQKDPREALEIAFYLRPSEWDVNFVEQVLPVLFAVSHREKFMDYLYPLIQVIRKNSQDIVSYATNPELDGCTQITHYQEYQAKIGYGCIEFKTNLVTTMVKTRFSQAHNRCDN